MLLFHDIYDINGGGNLSFNKIIIYNLTYEKERVENLISDIIRIYLSVKE